MFSAALYGPTKKELERQLEEERRRWTPKIQFLPDVRYDHEAYLRKLDRIFERAERDLQRSLKYGK